jgi:ferritin-like metal-binding protein YciE
MQASELKEIFVDELRDIYSAETQSGEGATENGKGGGV